MNTNEYMEFVIQLSKKDCINFSYHHIYRNQSRKARITGLICFLISTVTVVAYFYTTNLGKLTRLLGHLFNIGYFLKLGMNLFVFFGCYIMGKYIFRKYRHFQKPLYYRIDKEFICVKGEEYDSKQECKNLQEISENKNAIFLYPQESECYILPKRFLTEEQIVFLRSLITSTS